MSYGVAAYADLPLYGLPVAVFDFETTGVDPRECKAVELAIVHCNLGQDNAEVVFELRQFMGLVMMMSRIWTVCRST